MLSLLSNWLLLDLFLGWNKIRELLAHLLVGRQGLQVVGRQGFPNLKTPLFICQIFPELCSTLSKGLAGYETVDIVRKHKVSSKLGATVQFSYNIYALPFSRARSSPQIK